MIGMIGMGTGVAAANGAMKAREALLDPLDRPVRPVWREIRVLPGRLDRPVWQVIRAIRV
jgi:hypothetical protein